MNDMKDLIISEIKEKLSLLGVPVLEEAGTDLAIGTELLDAKWPTGSRTIRYEAMILADEQAQTVLMYEKTSESAQGLSFGIRGESTFQSGGTLYRKVKIVQHGPGGKALEFAFDLGAIPGLVREAAQRRGWKFKTVISRKKASYPSGD